MSEEARARTAADASHRRGAPEPSPRDPWVELLGRARIAITEQDTELRYTAALDPAASAGGDVVGKLESEVFEGEGLERLVALKRRAIESGTSLQDRVRVAANGGTRWLEATVTPRQDERGDVTALLTLCVDLTEAVRATERLRASETRLAGILRSAMDAIVSVDADHRIVYFNPAAERMFGVSAEDAIGTDVSRFVPDDVREKHRALMRSFGETGTTARHGTTLGTLRALRASGETFPIEASISRAGSGPGQLLTVIIRDRSEHDQLQAQLLQSQKLEGIGRLAGGVAHDFNNLLTVILGYCELLRMRQHTGVELEEIQNAARRASQLTRQLLAFSRRQVLQVETVDLNQLIRGLQRMLRRIIGEDVGLETDLADAPAWVLADVGQMEQVLLNLVVNARDAMPSGGTLRIGTRVVEEDASGSADAPSRASVELIVSDTGMGMSDDVRTRIFEPFFTTKGDSGTGLGLSTVYGIVMQTGGEIAVTSAPGEGATFRVRLPLAGPPKGEGTGAAQGEAVRGTELVLLVEDEGFVREFASRALREYGYEVLEASDAESALRHIDNPRLALVVSDVVMPDRSGDDLRAEIARRRPGLPVLLMTGYSEALFERPVDPKCLLRKPFTSSDLIVKIRHLLDGRQG